MQHHLHYFDLYPSSFALISPREDCEFAIVFIHGFGGDAANTWSDLHLMVDQDERFRARFSDADLFFFDYPSVEESLDSSVNRFKEFLTALIPTPRTELFEVNVSPLYVDDDLNQENHSVSALPAARHYRDLVLVGHSEGGVVVRTLLKECAAEQSPLADALRDSGVALFAPAIFGYAPSGILGFLANAPVLGDILDAALRISPAYRDLQPEKKNLEKLQLATEKLARETAHQAYRAMLLWGRKDRIVQDGHYEVDEWDYRTDHGHVSICKPTDSYPDPATLILSKRKTR